MQNTQRTLKFRKSQNLIQKMGNIFEQTLLKEDIQMANK